MANDEKKTTLGKFELGVLVTIVLAIVGFAFWLGGLQKQVDRLDAEKLKALFDTKITEAVSKSVVPPGTIIAWFATSAQVPEGWIPCDGAPGSGTPDLRGRFLRGTTDYKQVGQTGGRESHFHADVRKNGSWDGQGWVAEGKNMLGRSDEQNHLPPYCQVVYIMRK